MFIRLCTERILEHEQDQTVSGLLHLARLALQEPLTGPETRLAACALLSAVDVWLGNKPVNRSRS